MARLPPEKDPYCFMPIANHFRHQSYDDVAPRSEYRLVQPEPPPPLGSEPYFDALAAAGQDLAADGVTAIYLIHGTLAGTDVSGLLGELGRVLPEWAEFLRQREKQIIDELVGDLGNYNDEFVDTLERGINARLDRPIAVRRYLWSSENHHLGRADGAVRLLNQLYQSNDDHMLLWGHSHAGNVLALLTNLLGGDVRERRRFFRASRTFFQDPGDGQVDMPAWEETRRILERPGSPLAGRQIDIVTFGTPIRYGWDAAGYRRLVHFVNHHPVPGLPDYQAPFPPSREQVTMASSGDLIQQLFIAGTNFPPNVLAWRSWFADRRLGKLVQSGRYRRNLWKSLKAGVRVPDEGLTLLVDYARGDEPSARLLAGHAVYTMRLWLPFHLRTLADGCGLKERN